VLLLLSVLSAFATWLVGIACDATGIDQWLTPFDRSGGFTLSCVWDAKRWCDDG